MALSCLATALPNEPGDQGYLRACGFHTQCGACMGGQGTFGWERVVISTTAGVTSDTLGSHLELPEKTEAPPLPGPTPAWAPFHFLYLQLIDDTPVIPRETQRGWRGNMWGVGGLDYQGGPSLGILQPQGLPDTPCQTLPANSGSSRVLESRP